jgi:hypothetical protein
LRIEAAVTTSSSPIAETRTDLLPDENAELARRLHHRQMIRRASIMLPIVAFIALLCVIMVPVGNHISTSWLLGMSGTTVNWEIDEDNWITGGESSVSFNPQSWHPRLNDKEVALLLRLHRVVSVSLSEIVVTDEGLAPLKALTHLKVLDLARLYQFRYPQWSAQKSLTDASLNPLLGLKHLESLSLAGNRITNHGLSLLTSLPSLTDLNLSCTDVGDEGIPHLLALKNLKTVNLGATLFTTEGLKKLRLANPNLEVINDVSETVEHEIKLMRMKKP